MSSALALAGVTYVLRDLLNDRLINNNLAANVRVTSRPPMRDPNPASGEQSQLNVFLYQVTPNAGGRNLALPSRDFSGTRVANPPLALDLHYLITAYDERDYHAEVLLGYAMQLLHENPGLSREQLRKSLGTDIPNVPPGSSPLPPELRQLTRTGLADQIESLKITPHYLNTEEMSKLWTGFQAPYRPSMAYQVSMVLIETEQPVRSPLPVLTRGVEDRGPSIQANLLVPLPTLVTVLPLAGQPSTEADAKVKLFGHHLRGSNLVVTLRHATLDLTLTIAGVTGANPALVIRSPDVTERKLISPEADTCLVVDLAQAVAANGGSTATGWYSISVAVRPDSETQDRQTNTLPVAIAPRFATSGANAPVVAALGNSRYRVTLTCTPSLQLTQKTAFVLGQNEFTLVPPAAFPTAALSFEGTLPSAGKYLARLRIDGLDSLFIQRPDPGRPAFDPAQFIQIP